MKNLRKVLAVVLVICMAFSLMAVASAKSDFSDQTSVKYTEAVDLASGLGIMVGSGGTGFEPTGTFTREMAAKVICFILLGKSISESLSTSTSSFKDVVATRWSAPYIEYGVSAGIIAGMGDGTFAPTAPVTGSQFAKMLLVALGYGAKGEFTGANWEINAIVKAQSIGILDTGVNYSAAATREQVAKYVFNVLTKASCFTVTYNAVLGTYVGNYDTSTSGEPALTNAKTAAGLGALTFHLVNAPTFLFGQPAHIWRLFSNTGTAVTAVYSSTTVLHTAYDLTAVQDIIDLMTPSNAAYVVPVDASVTPIFNGAAGTPAALGSVALATPVMGSVVQLVDTNGDGDVDIISVTTKTVVKLNATVPVQTTTTGVVTTVTMPDITGLTGIVSTNVTGYQGLVKGDYVLWYTDGAGKYFIEKAASVTGTITARTTSTATINGAKYYVSGITGAAALTTDVLTGTTLFGVPNVTFYLDNGGNIVAAVSPTAAVTLADYVFLRNVGNVSVGLGTKVAANAVFTDGTTAELTIAKVWDTNAYVTATTGLVHPNSFYTFVKNADGTYNVKEVAAARQTRDNTTPATQKAAAFLVGDTTHFANANTVFLYQGALGTFTKYTGVVTAPTYSVSVDTANSGVYVLLDATATPTYALAVVGAGGTATNTTAAADLVFVTGPATEVYDAVASYNTYPAIVNGVATTIKTDNLALTRGTLYQVATYSGDKIASMAGSVANSTPATNVSSIGYNAGTLTVGAASYLTASDVKVIVYNGGVIPATSSVTTVDAIASLLDINGDDSVVVVKDLTNTVTAIYITIA